MSHPIFEISELVRLIADELVEVSPRAAVSFALTCRSLEEPALCPLWKRQESFGRLLLVLPSCAWAGGEDGYPVVVSDHDIPAYRI